jgi:hypothetical protein
MGVYSQPPEGQKNNSGSDGFAEEVGEKPDPGRSIRPTQCSEFFSEEK